MRAAVVVLSLLVAGCPQRKEAPVISSLDGSRSVEAGDSADYTCEASDPELKQLSYAWSNDCGRLGWSWGDSVRWFAPESSGDAVIRVTVSDEDGLTAEDSLAVTIRAETAGVLFWDAAVKAGDFQSWSYTMRAGYVLYGNCGSEEGEIYLKVMDDTNFAKWVAGQPSVAMIQQRPHEVSAFSVPIAALGLYHLIMDNTRGTEDNSYWLNIWKAGP